MPQSLLSLLCIAVLCLSSLSRAETVRPMSGSDASSNNGGTVYIPLKPVPPDADQNDPAVQFQIGVSYWLRQDYSQAITWFRKAADQGFEAAQVNLGAMYANGEGTPQDYEQALFWYSKAAQQGDPMADEAIKRLQKIHDP